MLTFFCKKKIALLLIEFHRSLLMNFVVVVQIRILKVKRKLTLVVDKTPALKIKVPKQFKLDGLVFVGGLPEEGAPDPASQDAYDGLKGCIRNVNLNGQPHDLASSGNVIHRVGQCFAHVETGSYFPGDAYAIYSTLNSFDPSNSLEFNCFFFVFFFL